MNEELDILNEEQVYEEPVKDLDFKCPNCGEVHQDDIIFLCNRCDSKEMIKKNGIFICPKCLDEGENFMCQKCDSKEVKLKSKL